MTHTTLTILRPDDWHVHLREGVLLKAVLPFTARSFARAVVMPNLRPPVTTTARAAAYRDEILAAIPEGLSFAPLMTLYLTDATDPEDLAGLSRRRSSIPRTRRPIRSMASPIFGNFIPCWIGCSGSRCPC